MPCAQTALAGACHPGETIRITVRLADGRYCAVALNSDGTAGRVVIRDDRIYGPAGAPFGFYRRIPRNGTAVAAPPNLAPDPLQTIVTVHAVDRAYDVRFAGSETIGGRIADRLHLRPLRDPDAYPLRDLWVDRASLQVVRLTYELPFNASHALVQYDFAAAGNPPAWSIVHIAASAGRDHVSQDLHDISFPASVPPSCLAPETSPPPAP